MARLVLSMLLPSPETGLVTSNTWPHGPPLLPCMSVVQSTLRVTKYAARGSVAATAGFEAIRVDTEECTVHADTHNGVLGSATRFRSAFGSWKGSKPMEASENSI